MTPAELQILLANMDSLGRTFTHNRDRAQQANESELDRELRRWEMGQRLGEGREERGFRAGESAADRKFRGEQFEADREFRGGEARSDRELRWRMQGDEQNFHRGENALNRQLTADQQQRVAAYQQQMLTLQKDENEQRRSEGFFRIMADMNKDGLLTEDGLNKMSEAFSQRFAPAGVGVKLFKLPSATSTQPQEYRHPRTGKEFITYGKSIMSADEPFAEVREEPDTIDPTKTKRTVTRKVRPSDLDKPSPGAAPPQRDPASGPDEELQREMDAIYRTPPAEERSAPSQPIPQQGPPAPGMGPGSPPNAPAPQQRKPGMVYMTPRGAMKWTGTGWRQP